MNDKERSIRAHKLSHGCHGTLRALSQAEETRYPKGSMTDGLANHEGVSPPHILTICNARS